MLIIPAIDIINGKCVRLTKGDYKTSKIYSENPIETAKIYESHGIKNLHLVDLDGAKGKGIVNHKILEEISYKTNLIIDFGGGIKSDEDIKNAFEYGADMVTIGSVAVNNPEIAEKMILKYGAEKIILGADTKNNLIAKDGWINMSNYNLNDFIKFYLNKGLNKVICTDIDKDGMLSGPSIELYKKIISGFDKIKLIASGGIKNMVDVKKLSSTGCYAAIIGKAIYEKTIDLKEIEKYILEC